MAETGVAPEVSAVSTVGAEEEAVPGAVAVTVAVVTSLGSAAELAEDPATGAAAATGAAPAPAPAPATATAAAAATANAMHTDTAPGTATTAC
jgi:hypothetical protein